MHDRDATRKPDKDGATPPPTESFATATGADEPGREHGSSAAAERIGPSPSQVVGSAAAAVSAALIASRLGVAGTLIGAAVVSMVSTIGAAYYTTFVKTTHDRVRRLRSVALRPARPRERLSGLRLRGWGLGALAAFVLAVAAITVLELGLGHPVSTSEDSGTSVGSVFIPPQPRTEPTRPGPSSGPAQTGSPAPSPTGPAPTTGTATHSGPTSAATSGPTGPATSVAPSPDGPTSPVGVPTAPEPAPEPAPAATPAPPHGAPAS